MNDEIRQILVIKPSSMGDILHLFPALQLLHDSFPAAAVDFLVHPAFSRILDFSPVPIRRRILFERQKLAKFPGCFNEFFKLLREVRREKYDLVVDFQGLLRSSIFAALSRHHRSAGFAFPREKAAELFYREKFPVSPSLHAVERNWQLAAGCAGIAEPGGAAVCQEPPASAASPVEGVYTVVLPAARWASKTFPPELFAAVMSRINSRYPEHTFILAGTAEDSPAAAAIKSLLPAEFPVTDLTGKTGITELFELIRHAAALLSNDSGPLHAAAVFNIPAFAFYGSTDPALTGPWGSRATVYRNDSVPCLGCLKRVCPEPETLCHRIDPEKVAADMIKSFDTAAAAAEKETDNTLTKEV